MKKFFALTLLVATAASAMDRGLMTAVEIAEKARYKDKLIAKGTVSKAITLDVFMINDGTGNLVIDMTGRRQKLKVGDHVTVYGKYRGISRTHDNTGELQVTEFLQSDTDKKMLEQHPAESDAVESTQPKRNVQSRLEELEKLRSTNLITPDEYQEQRKRILNDL